MTTAMQKRVAFSWVSALEESNGGVERVTTRLMEGFTRRGASCFFILQDAESDMFWHGEEPIHDLESFLNDNHIDTLINQNGYSGMVSEHLDGETWQGNYIVCFHNEPLFLQKLFGVRRAISYIISAGNTPFTRIAWLARLLVYPLWRWFSDYSIGKTQRKNYNQCNHYVLLSQEFVPQFAELIREQQTPKALAINNPLSFEVAPDDARRFEKSKEVLIVARLNDWEKRISSALLAWQAVESENDDWTLNVIGEGPDSEKLHELAASLRLERVNFLGRKDPLPHYKSAAIFLMTSHVEGWGLTVTEAMQTGTVPVAFNGYASITDIISSEQSGIIVENGNVSLLAEEVLKLIGDPDRLKAMSDHAISAAQSFNLENVVDQWESIV